MKAGFPYQRIGPLTSHVFGHDSLWLGADHLLAVANRRFVEDYRRFDLREIQAIVMCKQFRFIVPVYWLLAFATAFIVVIVGTVRGSRPLADTGWAIVALLGIYWVAASLAGSCSCHLQTAVDSYELPGLYRLWAARRVLQTLEARIAEIQGVLPNDWTADDSVHDAPIQMRIEVPEPVAGRLPPFLLPALACLAFLIDALISWLIRDPNTPRVLRTLSAIVTLVAVVLPIVALVVTRHDKRFQHIRILFLVAVFAVGVTNYGATVITSFLGTLQQVGQPAPAAISGINNVLFWVNEIAEASAGSLGLLDLLGEARGGTLGRQSSAL